MLRITIFSFLVFTGLLTLLATDASGQLNQTKPLRSLANGTFNYLSSRPTVSPYLGLLQQQNLGGVPAYHSVVRPRLQQIQQQREQDQQRAQIAQVQNHLSSVRHNIRRAQDNNGVFPTGHPTRYGNTMHYYPALIRR